MNRQKEKGKKVSEKPCKGVIFHEGNVIEKEEA